MVIVGLPDAAVQESRERVQAAIKNAGLYFPRKRITVTPSAAATGNARVNIVATMRSNILDVITHYLSGLISVSMLFVPSPNTAPSYTNLRSCTEWPLGTR